MSEDDTDCFGRWWRTDKMKCKRCVLENRCMEETTRLIEDEYPLDLDGHLHWKNKR